MQRTNRLRMILASANGAEASRTEKYFQHRGWEVTRTGTGVEARRLSHTISPDAVILDTDLPDETGWLTCAKLRLARPAQKVVLVGPEQGSDKHLSNFVGAAAIVSTPEVADIFSAL